MAIRLGVPEPLVLDGARLGLPGIVDSFDRPDGPIGNGWQDAADVWPALFDPAVIEDGIVAHYPSHTNTVGSPPSNYKVGHVLAAIETGVSTNFEVGIDIRFDLSEVVDDLLGQVAPCALIDLSPESPPLGMGVVAVWDISLPQLGLPTYMHNAFRTSASPSDVLDRDPYYRGYDLDTPGFVTGTGQPGPFALLPSTAVSIRVVGNMMRYYWNHQPRGDVVAVPDWAEGRTMHGFHIVGTADNADPPIEPDVVLKWWWRPFDGSL